MYAKDIRPPTRKPPVTPPQNYSGTAFAEPRPIVTPIEPPLPPPAVAADAPALPPPPEQPKEKEEEQDVPTSAPEQHEHRPKPPRGILSSLIPPGFSGGDWDLGFEELLLVGLIFLLSRGENDSDILLMLALLLLYR